MSTIVLRRATRPVRRSDLFGPFAGPFPVTPLAVAARAAAPAPSVVLERDDQDGVLTVDAPGLDAARDLSVEVTGSRLTVAGTRRETSGRTRRETRFSRSVELAEGLTADAVTARYEAGVLRVRVAGMFPAPVTPETVTVAITSDVPASDAPAPQAPAPQAPAAEGQPAA